jgi:hypothetical protein
VDTEHYLGRCAFSEDERFAMFEGLWATIPDGQLAMETAIPGGFKVAGAYGGAFYGVQGGSVVRLNPATLQSETVFEPRAADLCAAPPGYQAHQLLFPPDGRSVALLRYDCGCIDCDYSATFALRLDSGTAELVERPWADHEVYDIAWPAQGGALVFSTQVNYPDGRSDSIPERRPQAGQFLAVDASGAVQTVGPVPGVDGVAHAPVVPPLTPAFD